MNYVEIRKLRLQKAREKGKHTKKEWIELTSKINLCVNCGSSDKPLTKDHIIPLYQGGSDSIDNIQPLCKNCNSSKGSDDTNLKEKYLRGELAWM